MARLQTRRRRLLSAAEVSRLADAMPDCGTRALVFVGAHGGLRYGELVALRRDRCDLLRRSLIVDAALGDVGGRLEIKAPKSHQARRVSLPVFVVEALARHLETVPRDSEALVFAAPRGGLLRYSNLRRRVWDLAAAAAQLDGVTPTCCVIHALL